MFTLEKLYKKSLRYKYRFVMYHLEERSVSTAIHYKRCAQIFVLSVNKNPIQYTICDATNSYTVQCEHSLSQSQNKWDNESLKIDFLYMSVKYYWYHKPFEVLLVPKTSWKPFSIECFHWFPLLQFSVFAVFTYFSYDSYSN